MNLKIMIEIQAHRKRKICSAYEPFQIEKVNPYYHPCKDVLIKIKKVTYRVHARELVKALKIVTQDCDL